MDDAACRECTGCRHFRNGRSVADGAYAAVERSMQPKVRPLQAQAFREETDSVGIQVEERQSRAAKGIDTYTRRPTTEGLSYCGQEEFRGTYRIHEVKNRDGSCSDHKQRSSEQGPRSCETCCFNVAATPRVRAALETFLRDVGAFPDRQTVDAFRQQLDAAIDAQVQYEYQLCVAGEGFLEFVPAYLPYCLARSDERRAVVGPVVNAGAQCELWAAGTADSDVDERLAELDAAISEARRVSSNNELLASPHPVGDPLIWSEWLQLPVRRARWAFVAYCLEGLGLPDEFVATSRAAIVSAHPPYKPDEEVERRAREACRYVQKKFGFLPPGVPDDLADPSLPMGPNPYADFVEPYLQEQWQQPTTQEEFLARSADGPFAAEVTPAEAQPTGTPPDEPEHHWLSRWIGGPPRGAGTTRTFKLRPNKRYRHPDERALSMTVQLGPLQAVAVVETGQGTLPIDLAALPPQVWTPLTSPLGPLPVALLNDLPAGIHGTWLRSHRATTRRGVLRRT